MAGKSDADRSLRAAKIDGALRKLYPETTALTFSSPFTLLVAAVLAAQCTDERVNAVTSTLFEEFPDPGAFAGADSGKLEEAVHSTGFYKQKAATLKKLCGELVKRHGGRVPETLEELTALPGIGRKTANLVLGNSLGKPAIFVDTHVKRIAFRMGLTMEKEPDAIEADLAPLVREDRRTAFSNLLTHLGRDVCTARKPACARCSVNALCDKAGV